jgi:1-acyl-sn-glycerol-3-phosphate acyltransferase
MRVLPFKSALFAVAEMMPGDRPIVLQPVSIAYTRLNGLPMGRFYRPLVAWYGDMDMASHLWTLLGFGTITVSIEFHSPLLAADYASRKALGEACQRIVASGVAAALSGREQSPETRPSQPSPSEPGPTVTPSPALPVAPAEA